MWVKSSTFEILLKHGLCVVAFLYLSGMFFWLVAVNYVIEHVGIAAVIHTRCLFGVLYMRVKPQ